METKRFVVVGHVDHGKSTLCGNLLYQTGNVSEHDMNNIVIKAEKDKMVPWKWARVLDIYEEEQRRGKTNEYVAIDFKFNDKMYQLVDTPGHKGFIRSMITGIYQSPEQIGCLIVSALPKEFEAGFEKAGQTKEDILLIRAVGITDIIVCINKMDAVDWKEDLYKGYIAKIDKYLKNLNFTSVKYVPTAGYKGLGVIDVNGLPEWYKGTSFIDSVDEMCKGLKAKQDKDKKKEVKTDIINTKCVIVSFTVLSEEEVITSDYRGVIHYHGGEMEFKVDKILTINSKPTVASHNYGRFKDKIEVGILFDHVVQLKKEDKFVFRDKETTVGFGRVLKIKPVNK